MTGPEIDLELGTMHAVETVSTQKIEGLIVSRQDKKVEIKLPKVYSRNQIPVRREQIPVREMALQWTHLHPIAEKIPSYRENVKVGLLIGNNYVRAIKPRSVIPGRSSDPYAIWTALGWGIIGAENDVKDKNSEHATCNRVVTKEIGKDGESELRFIQPSRCREAITPTAINNMFAQDFSELNENDKPYSQEDVKFMKRMKDGIHKGDDGHYELPLPPRDENLKLPPNRDLAEKRLYQLKKRFDRDLKYKEDYTRFMNDMINSGYAEEAPNDCESAWYIPHHGVYHSKKPEKIRVVFNCSAETQKQSLNQHLLQGLDLTNSLSAYFAGSGKNQ